MIQLFVAEIERAGGDGRQRAVPLERGEQIGPRSQNTVVAVVESIVLLARIRREVVELVASVVETKDQLPVVPCDRDLPAAGPR